MKITARVLEKYENSLCTLGLPKAGIAWHQSDFGSAFQGIQPGMIAHQISDQDRRRPGDIVVTTPVVKRLSPEYAVQFSPVEDEQCNQDQVYIRKWNENSLDYLGGNSHNVLVSS